MGAHPGGTRHRLASIDLLRGAAALGVVLYHATEGRLFLDQWNSAPWMTALGPPAAVGFSGVYLFFVISGFCIHMAWARQRAEGLAPRIDFLAFWKRRVRRLYPPYLVALVVYLFLLWEQGLGPTTSRPVSWDIGLHVLMIHNIDPETVLSINGVFWTLAIEEQLYLAYFLFLALRSRLGWLATLAICLLARVLWFALAFLLHRTWGLHSVVTEAAASHWFVWVLGAWSVEAWLGLVRRPAWTNSVVLCAGALSSAALLHRGLKTGALIGVWGDLAWLLEHPLWGLGFFVLLNRFTRAEGATQERPCTGQDPRGRLSRGLRFVGLFSYSLYLTHQIILTHLGNVMATWPIWSEAAWIQFRVFALAPLAVGFAWAFFKLFEQPFLSSSSTIRP